MSLVGLILLSALASVGSAAKPIEARFPAHACVIAETIPHRFPPTHLEIRTGADEIDRADIHPGIVKDTIRSIADRLPAAAEGIQEFAPIKATSKTWLAFVSKQRQFAKASKKIPSLFELLCGGRPRQLFTNWLPAPAKTVAEVDPLTFSPELLHWSFSVGSHSRFQRRTACWMDDVEINTRSGAGEKPLGNTQIESANSWNANSIGASLAKVNLWAARVAAKIVRPSTTEPIWRRPILLVHNSAAGRLVTGLEFDLHPEISSFEEVVEPTGALRCPFDLTRISEAVHAAPDLSETLAKALRGTGHWLIQLGDSIGSHETVASSKTIHR